MRPVRFGTGKCRRFLKQDQPRVEVASPANSSSVSSGSGFLSFCEPHLMSVASGSRGQPVKAWQDRNSQERSQDKASMHAWMDGWTDGWIYGYMDCIHPLHCIAVQCIPFHSIPSHHTTSHHITPHHITSHHTTSHHTTSHHITSRTDCKKTWKTGRTNHVLEGT